MTQSKKVGYFITGFALFIMIVGTIGYTVEGEVKDIPTPNIEGFVFFSDDALPSNPIGLFVSADTSLTWDRDDIFFVIADESKKNQCDGILESQGGFLQTESGSQTCQYGDSGYEATSIDGTAGAQWRVTPGTYFAGIGTQEGTFPAGTEVNIDYQVKLSASFPTYLFCFLIGIGGAGLSRME